MSDLSGMVCRGCHLSHSKLGEHVLICPEPSAVLDGTSGGVSVTGSLKDQISPKSFCTTTSVSIAGYFGGKLLEKTMPLRYWTIWGYEFSLNPGPFNIKEHTLIYMLGGLILDAGPVAYGTHAIVTWEKRYNQSLSTGYAPIELSSYIIF